MASIILVSSLLSLALAQSTSLTLPVIGHDAASLGASVIAANPTATTFQLGCLQSADCGVFPKEIFVYGPSTYNINMADPNTDFTATVDCSFGSSGAVCKETAGGSEANFPGSSTETYAASEVGSITVVVTAGAEKLTAGATATASAGKSSAAAGASGSAVASQTASAGSVAASASKTGAAPASTSTGAAAANAVVLGGGLVGAAAGLLGGLLL